MGQTDISLLPRVLERRAVDVLNELGQSLGEEGQVDFVPDIVLGSLKQVQQGLQEGTQLLNLRHFLKRVRHLSSAIRLHALSLLIF